MLLLCCFCANAQGRKQYILKTKNTSLVFSVLSNLKVIQTYYGKKLASDSSYEKLQGGREIYLTAGMENQFEPAIRVVHADGNPSLELLYVSGSVNKADSNVSTTSITLKDPVYQVTVILHYMVYYNEDVIKAGLK